MLAGGTILGGGRIFRWWGLVGENRSLRSRPSEVLPVPGSSSFFASCLSRCEPHIAATHSASAQAENQDPNVMTQISKP